MLTDKQIEFINALTQLTKSNKINWVKYNTPNSYAWVSEGVRYISNGWASEVDNNVFQCCELAIEEMSIVTSDFVACNDGDSISDFNYLNTLHSEIKNNYARSTDDRFENYLKHLPR